MGKNTILSKLAITGIIGIMCVGLSYVVLGLVLEREARAALNPPYVTVSSSGETLHNGFFAEVSDYRKLVRTIKYAILFFVVTFGSIFLIEVLFGLRVHPVQYFLFGAALALFYLLLLAFSEYLGFLRAYLISTTMIVTMLAGYSKVMFKRGAHVVRMASILILAYAYLYVVVSLEEYALLLGSLMVFCLLGAMMYFTRNIDWFEYKAG